MVAKGKKLRLVLDLGQVNKTSRYENVSTLSEIFKKVIISGLSIGHLPTTTSIYIHNTVSF